MFLTEKSNFSRESGQSMIEIIVALTISAILVTAASGAVALALRKNLDVKTTQIAASLSQEYLDGIQSLAESDWLAINGIAEGGNYHLAASGTSYAIVSGATTTVVEGINFTRYFFTENVNRDSCGVGNITSDVKTLCSGMESGSAYVADDPSTKKITVTVEWSGNRTLSQFQYITRNRDFVFHQTDWFGGPGQEYFSTTTERTAINNRFASSTGISFSSSSVLFSTASSSTLISSVYTAFPGASSASSGMVAINSVIWRGDASGDDIVGFRIASSNCLNGAVNYPVCDSGSWDFIGPDGTPNTQYSGGQDDSLQINPAHHNNKRFFRYEIYLVDIDGDKWPRVDDVIINWSK